MFVARHKAGRVAAIATLLAFGAAGCASIKQADTSVLCAGAGIVVHGGFSGAGRHDCVVAPDGSVIVSVDHEPSVLEGINPSPWYAFKVDVAEAGQRTIVLDYTDYKHRYTPEVSVDGGVTWQHVAEDAVTLNERESRATIVLDLPVGEALVAGEPLASADEQLSWTRSAVADFGFEEVEYGRSLDGRALIGFVGGAETEGAAMVVAITRQHPPETTGQEAFRAFVDQLLATSGAEGAGFLRSHRILLAPMPNPDGVIGGHWRLNSGGIDLNRDWGPFTQPESQALSKWILEQADGRNVVAFFDFHSTNRNVIYAPPMDAPSPTIEFLTALKAHMDGSLEVPPDWSFAHNENGGTTKGWALEKLKAPGITVELDDEASEAVSREIGASVADAVIAYFAN